MRVTMLGSGTSSGVPVIGCDCAVCTSSDPRNRRTRPGLRLDLPQGIALVDAPPDLRLQALENRLPRVDAVLFTHAHADHIFGLDDIRIFNFRQRMPIPCLGSAATLSALRRVFAYVFEEGQEGGGRPDLELREIAGPFRLLGSEVVPVPVWHGSMPVLGFRLGRFAYVTDCNRIPEESMALLRGVEVLILDALRYKPHPTHFNLDQAIEVASQLAPRRTIFTHLTHDVDATALERPLPPGMELGFDGLVIDLP